jgi:hypothetical protein
MSEGFNTTHHAGGPQDVLQVAGAAAGNLTVTGVATCDTLLHVYSAAFDTDGDITGVSDLVDEFSITAANTINNTGGTSTADNLVTVVIQKGHPNS